MVVKFGDVKVKVIGKKFYCRYCDDFDTCRKRPHHRSGIFFLCEAGDSYFVIGSGESEAPVFPEIVDYEDIEYSGMSGCEKGKGWYKTCGGWISVSFVSRKKEEVGEIGDEVELTPDEKIAFLRTLEEKANKVVTLGEFDLQKDWGVWEPKKVLKKYWLRGKQYMLYEGAVLKEIERSYSAVFQWNEWTVRVPKPRKVESEILTNGGEPVCFCVKDEAKNWIIWWNNKDDRKVLYWTLRYREMEEGDGVIVGLEQYKEFKHPRCEIDVPREELWWRFIDKLFTRRLGDVMFLKEVPEWAAVLDWTDDRLKKVEREGNRVMHPEHGTLEIEEGAVPVAVPYRFRGHD